MTDAETLRSILKNVAKRSGMQWEGGDDCDGGSWISVSGDDYGITMTFDSNGNIIAVREMNWNDYRGWGTGTL